MKKLILCLTLCITNLLWSQCPTTQVVLQTQADVDNYFINYPNCTNLPTSLRIGGSDITNLNGLNGITHIGGVLFIGVPNTGTSLTNLSGLDALISIGGNVMITENPYLTSLDGLESLVSIGGYLRIGWNVAEDEGNPLLQNIDGLQNLQSLGDYLLIDDNDSLIDVDGLNSLTQIGGGITITNNASLTNLSGLNNVNSIYTTEFHYTGYNIKYNNSLLTLSTLDYIEGGIDITENPLLQSLQGLNNVQNVENLNIRENDNLTDLEGLNGLTQINDVLSVGYNDELLNFDGLENLIAIDGLFIEGNDSLTDISALTNINNSGFHYLAITSNPFLSICAYPFICQFINTGLIDFYMGANAPGCNSKEEVFDDCNSGSQVTAYQPTDLEICDNSLPNDGFAIFDLTTKNAEIIGSQDPSDLMITYYSTFNDAVAGINEFMQPQAYINETNPETVYARLENIQTGDFDLTDFSLFVWPLPTAIQPTPLAICDENGDGFTIFDLTEKDGEISLSAPFVDVTYHENLLDAESGVNPLASPYINIIPFTQIVYARVINTLSGCFAIVELELIAAQAPSINQPNNLFIDEGDGDGLAIFDLTVNTPIILGSLNPSDYYVYYYDNEVAAQTNGGRIANPEEFANTSNPQAIYVRVEEINTSCFALTSFEILTDETTPDADGDGIANEDEDLNNNGNLNDDDTDGDGIPNYLDSDDDGDTVQTIDETTGIGAGVAPNYIFIDTDGDTIENYLDNDVDGDDTLTIDEDYNNNGNPIDDDINANGIPDFLDEEVFLSVNSFSFEGLSIYPNPTSESFTVQSSQLVLETAISLYDLQGKLLFSEKMLPQNGKLTMDISSLENGVYFIKISSEGNSIVKKLLKI